MATKYQVTDSRGQVHKRTTKDRTYTHCVVAHLSAIPARDSWREWPAYTHVQWCGRPDLARKAAASWAGAQRLEGVEIITAVEVTK